MNVRQVIEQLESAIASARIAGMKVEECVKELREWFGLTSIPAMTEPVKESHPTPVPEPKEEWLECPDCGFVPSNLNARSDRVRSAMTRHRRALHSWTGSFASQPLARPVARCPICQRVIGRPNLNAHLRRHQINIESGSQ